MKALAFIGVNAKRREIATLRAVRKRDQGRPHPSEDGEALRQIRLNSLSESALVIGSAPRHPREWFALYTTCRHEKRVAQHLGQREIEHYLPLFQSQRKWADGSRVTLDLPLFPGYVFVRMDRTERVRVLEVPGALSIVGGTGAMQAPLPDTEVEALRFGAHERKAVPHPLLRVGSRARIRSGALAGMEGVVVRKKNSALRMVLTLDLVMQSIAVEVSEDELEPLDTVAPISN